MKRIIKISQGLKQIQQVVLLLSLFALCFPIWANAGVFVDNLVNPTGLAIHPTQRFLYIKSGVSGTLWKAEILNNGQAGAVSVVTNNFPPTTQICFDFQGNLYGINHTFYTGVERQFLHSLKPNGNICGVCVNDAPGDLGLAIEFPGLASNNIFFLGDHSSFLHLGLNNIPCSGYYYGLFIGVTCSPIRYLLYSVFRGELIASHNNEIDLINIGNAQCQTLVANLIQPSGLAEDQQGNIYVADTGDGSVTQLNMQGTTKKVAQGFYLPSGLAYDAQTGLVFVSETGLNRVSAFSLSDPAIGLNTRSLTPYCPLGKNARSQKFDIWNSGSSTLNYTISWNVPWLNVSPSSGSSVGEHDSITVNYSTVSLPLGTHTDFITINASGATNSPQQIRVDLKVANPSLAELFLLLD